MTKQRRSLSEFLRWVALLGIGLFILVLVFDKMLSVAVTNNLINSLDTREQILLDTAFVSGALTLVLVYIYQDLGSIQRAQSRILEKQSDLMRLQHKPRLYVREFDPDLVGPYIGVELENMGNSPGERIALRADLLAAKSSQSRNAFTHLNDLELAPGEYEFSSRETPLQRFEPRENKRLSGANALNAPSINSSARLTGGSLATTDGRVWFKGYISFFDTPNLDPLAVPVQHLHDSGFERAALYLTVIYADIEENLQGTLITHIEFPITDDFDGQQILEDQPIWSHNLDDEVCRQIKSDLGEISLSGFNPLNGDNQPDAEF